MTEANRGQELEIVDAFDENYYVVKLESGYGLVQKRLVRLESEEPYESWEGFAGYNAMVYPTYTLPAAQGEALSLNTKVLVLDDLDGILVVQVEETLGYMAAEQVSTSFIQPYAGGNSGGGADGGDIVLGYRGGICLLATLAPQEGQPEGKATVLADGTEILLGWFDREEEVQIVTEEGFAPEREGYRTVYLGGVYGYIRQALVLQEGEEPYAQWTGYAQYNAVIYSGYGMTGESTKLNPNTELQILGDLGDCYLVQSGDAVGYMAKETVSEYPVVFSGGGSSGGGGGGEWTPPAM